MPGGPSAAPRCASCLPAAHDLRQAARVQPHTDRRHRVSVASRNRARLILPTRVRASLTSTSRVETSQRAAISVASSSFSVSSLGKAQIRQSLLQSLSSLLCLAAITFEGLVRCEAVTLCGFCVF